MAGVATVALSAPKVVSSYGPTNHNLTLEQIEATRMSEERLNLTADQQQQVSTLRQDLTRELDPIWARVDEKRAELRTLWNRDKPDRATLLAKQSEIDSLHENVRAAHVDFRLAVRELFTFAQRRELAAMSAGGAQMKDGESRDQAASCSCSNADTDMD